MLISRDICYHPPYCLYHAQLCFPDALRQMLREELDAREEQPQAQVKREISLKEYLAGLEEVRKKLNLVIPPFELK